MDKNQRVQDVLSPLTTPAQHLFRLFTLTTSNSIDPLSIKSALRGMPMVKATSDATLLLETWLYKINTSQRRSKKESTERGGDERL
jgi:hypothetical protein